jgi:uncharacterized protein (TIGR00369 family)
VTDIAARLELTTFTTSGDRPCGPSGRRRNVAGSIGVDERLRYANLPDTHFIHRADMRVAAPDEGTDAAVELDVTDDLSNGMGGLQGGMVATLVDCASGLAVRDAVGTSVPYSTQDLAVHYLAALRTGPARAVARVRHRGKRTIIVQVDVVDAGNGDNLCAVATVSFAVLGAPGT